MQSVKLANAFISATTKIPKINLSKVSTPEMTQCLKTINANRVSGNNQTETTQLTTDLSSVNAKDKEEKDCNTTDTILQGKKEEASDTKEQVECAAMLKEAKENCKRMQQFNQDNHQLVEGNTIVDVDIFALILQNLLNNSTIGSVNETQTNGSQPNTNLNEANVEQKAAQKEPS